MPSNVEIKARVRDFADLRRRAMQLSDAPVSVIPQVDTFFRTSQGRLKLRELGGGEGQLIYYERPDQTGPKRSDYNIYATRDAAALKVVLAMALGIRGTVEKTRYLYLVGQTRVHLDDVKGLGQFMELEVVLQPGQTEEAGQGIAQKLLAALGVDPADLMEAAYMDLLEQAA